jgi:hypothetical protein
MKNSNRGPPGFDLGRMMESRHRISTLRGLRGGRFLWAPELNPENEEK